VILLYGGPQLFVLLVKVSVSLGVEEQTVVAPWERLRPLTKPCIFRLGKLPMLGFDMFQVLMVLVFESLHVESENKGGRDTNEEANSTP